jgi:hypothetical protein
VFLLACAKLSFRGSNRKPKREKNKTKKAGLLDPPFAPFEMTPGELPWTPLAKKKNFFWLFYFFSQD